MSLELNILGYIVIFLFGGAIGSLITFNIQLRKTNQSNIVVGKGDVVGGDKKD